MDREMKREMYRDIFQKNEYRLDEYVLHDGKKHRFALVIPGGGFFAIAGFAEGKPVAQELNGLGYSVFVLYYRCRKKAVYPNPQEDVARALKDIFARAEELDLDRSCYSIWGFSAGGFLTASFGTENIGYAKYMLPKPGALILSYPVITMGEKTHGTTRKYFLGKNPADRMIHLTSVEENVTADYPPTFIWAGDADREVDPDNSKVMKDALQKNGVDHEFLLIPGADHGGGLGIGTPSEGWFQKAVPFWEKQMEKNRREI